MGSKGRFILLGLLLVLSVLCDSGHSLQCYSCLNPGGECTAVTTCSPNLDACLYVTSKTQTLYQCWKYDNCNFTYISQALGEPPLKYECCQKDKCNKSDGMRITGTTLLLVTPLLAAFWTLLI